MQNYVDVGASSGVRGGGRGADVGISHTNHSTLWAVSGKSIVSGLMCALCNIIASDAAIKPPC